MTQSYSVVGPRDSILEFATGAISHSDTGQVEGNALCTSDMHSPHGAPYKASATSRQRAEERTAADLQGHPLDGVVSCPVLPCRGLCKEVGACMHAVSGQGRLLPGSCFAYPTYTLQTQTVLRLVP